MFSYHETVAMWMSQTQKSYEVWLFWTFLAQNL